jgi:hypothetical protein
MSHDETLSSMAIWTVLSDGMAAGSPIWLRTPANLNSRGGSVRPHSIWNQISIGLPAASRSAISSRLAATCF